MTSWCSYNGLLSAFFLLGLLLFTRGFLLTRLELRRRSTASDLVGTTYDYDVLSDVAGQTTTTLASSIAQSFAGDSSGPIDDTQSNGGWEKATGDSSRASDYGASEPGSQAGWSPALYDRLVFIVIDAWRYDFASDPSRMPRLHSLLSAHPARAVLYESTADAPTVTLQRLKGMLTGSLPTFIDISANFHSSILEEDNWVGQWGAWAAGGGHAQAGQGGKGSKRAVFMGDDTWMGLFPGNATFTTSYPFPSFDVWDLHTVDDGIGQHITPTIRGEQGGWGLLVAHYLGLDHAGHRYHASHAGIDDKLTLMDESIDGVVQELQALACPASPLPSSPGPACHESILLVVTGDHGMTWDGNHGGASAEETSTALLTVSIGQRALRATPPSPKARPVHQIDLVPTLALAMGIPIPFASLGHVLEDWDWQDHRDSHSSACLGLGHEAALVYGLFDQLARTKALLLNAYQVDRYTHAYAAVAPSFSSTPGVQAAQHSYRALEEEWRQLLGRTVHLLQGDSDEQSNVDSDGRVTAQSAYLALSAICARQAALPSVPVLHSLHASHTRLQAHASDYLQGIAQVCRTLWTQFDVASMVGGLLTMAVTVSVKIALCFTSPPTAVTPPSMQWTSALARALAWPAWTSIAALAILTARLVCLFGDTCLAKEGVWVATLSAACVVVVAVDAARLWLQLQAGDGGDKTMRKGTYLGRVVALALLALVSLSIGQWSAPLAQPSSSSRKEEGAGMLPVTADSVAQIGYLTTVLPLLAGPSLLLFPLASYLSDTTGPWAHGGKGGAPSFNTVGGGGSRDAARVWMACMLLGTAVLAQWIVQAGALAAWLSADTTSSACLLLPRLVFAGSAACLHHHRRGRLNSRPTVTAALHCSALLLPSLALVLGPWSPLPLLSLVVLAASSTSLLSLWYDLRLQHGWHKGMEWVAPSWMRVLHGLLHSPHTLSTTLLACLLPSLAFSVTGHRAQFSALVYQAGFVGVESFSFLASGALLAWHTFGPGHVLMLACWAKTLPGLGLLPAPTGRAAAQDDPYRQAMQTLLTVPAMLTVFCTAVCATVLRRHLMVWAIFAPRFCFEAVSCCLSLATLHAPWLALLPAYLPVPKEKDED